MSRRIINYQEAGPSWLPDEMDDNGTDDEMDDDNEMDSNEMDDNEMDDNEMDDNEMDDNEMDDNEMDDNEIDDNEIEYTLHIFLKKKVAYKQIDKISKSKKRKNIRSSSRTLIIR